MKLRPYRPADFDPLADMFEAISIAAYGFNDQPREELRQWLTSPRVDVERDARLGFEGDRLVAYVDADSLNGRSWWSDVRVHPDLDPAEVVPELLAWAEERADGEVIRLWVPSPLDAQKRVYEAQGYRRVRASYRMEIEFDSAPEPPQFPPRIGVRTLQPGEEHAVYDVHQEAFEDSWEHERETYDEWEHYLLKAEAFDPTLWFLAWDADELAGISLCRVRSEMGWVAILAVRRPWRRKGLGRALLLHSFREFNRRGLRRAGLGVDAESLTGANRLYESAGMHVARQLDFYEKQLPSTS